MGQVTTLQRRTSLQFNPAAAAGIASMTAMTNNMQVTTLEAQNIDTKTIPQGIDLSSANNARITHFNHALRQSLALKGIKVGKITADTTTASKIEHLWSLPVATTTTTIAATKVDTSPIKVVEDTLKETLTSLGLGYLCPSGFPETILIVDKSEGENKVDIHLMDPTNKNSQKLDSKALKAWVLGLVEGHQLTEEAANRKVVAANARAALLN